MSPQAQGDLGAAGQTGQGHRPFEVPLCSLRFAGIHGGPQRGPGEGGGQLSAERWAAEIPSWHTAPAEGINAFAAANANVWSEISTADPDPWILRLATAATAWHAHHSAG